jgi:GNAT superfamily N-acetyltransferase
VSTGQSKKTPLAPPLKNLTIVLTQSADWATLTRLALASKRSWGYPAEWMAEWKPLLTIRPEFIQRNIVYKAIISKRVAGFYALCFDESPNARLEHLWVHPRFMRQGVGRAMFLHAIRKAKSRQKTAITIESDPNSGPFYKRMGAKPIGTVKTIVAGVRRQLPVLQYPLLGHAVNNPPGKQRASSEETAKT